jgi:hypothetical protein
MPNYCYRCDANHSSDRYFGVGMAKKSVACPECRLRAWRDHAAEMQTIHPLLKPNFTPHMNPSFGEHVESEKHLRHLQHTHGTCDVGAEDMGSPPPHFGNKGYSEPSPGADWVETGNPDDGDQPLEVVKVGL